MQALQMENTGMQLLSAQDDELAAMFDLAPIALFVKDCSALERLFAQWRLAGVDDLASFLKANPAHLQQCVAAMPIVRANRHTLALYQSQNLQTFQLRYAEHFQAQAYGSHFAELVALWNADSEFIYQTTDCAFKNHPVALQIHGRVMPSNAHVGKQVLVVHHDITASQKQLQYLQRNEQYARGLFEHSPVSLWIEDFSSVKKLLDQVRDQGVSDLRSFLQQYPAFAMQCMQQIVVLDINEQTLHLFSATNKQELLQNLPRIFYGEMLQTFSAQLCDLWEGKLNHHREVVNYSLNGQSMHLHLQLSVLPSNRQDWSLVLLSLIDITARKQAESHLEYISQHDVLTKLHNRAFYVEASQRLSLQGPWPVSVIAIDMNGLKTVNDMHGHMAGDAMLLRLANVLAQAIEAPASAARIGGDEFMVLLPGADEACAAAVCKRLLQLLDADNQHHLEQTIHISIGSATGLEGEAVETLVHLADTAMYAEKKRFYQNQQHEQRRVPA